MSPFPQIEIEGPPYERGRQYGARAAAAIKHNLEAYLRLIEFHQGLDRVAVRSAAQLFWPIIEAHAPNLLEEMKGIAAGSGSDPLDIVLINSRSELMGQSDECTALSASPEVTSQRRTFLAQNWDWSTAIEAEPVLLRVRQQGSPEILTLTEAGQVGKIGMNSSGLGVCLNFLSHSDRGPGLPVHVILRQMLECESLGLAIRTALSVPRGGAGNIMLAHAEGDILDLELTARDADYIYGDAGWLVHANHYESPRLKTGDIGLATSTSTLARAARARRMFAPAASKASISPDTMRSILSDHAYGAYAICRHPDSDEHPMQQSATRASVIMDLTSGALHLASGQPCHQEYQEHTV